MNDQLVSQIEDLGLSNKEARIYVASLTLGPSGVQTIADRSGIKRVTTYVILESLVSLGLVSQSVKGKKTLFIAEDPTNLRRLLDKREQEVKDQKQSFETILPELVGLKSVPKETPNIRFFDSAEGVRGIFATFFATYKGEDRHVYGISNLDQLHEFFPEMQEAMKNPVRTQNSVSSSFLYTTTRGPIYKQNDKEANRESRWVPPDQYHFEGDISIIGDHVIILSLSGPNPIGIMIHSREVARGMLGVFQVAWDGAAKYTEANS